MIEEIAESVQVHVGSFGGILKEFVVENFLVQVDTQSSSGIPRSSRMLTNSRMMNKLANNKQCQYPRVMELMTQKLTILITDDTCKQLP